LQRPKRPCYKKPTPFPAAQLTGREPEPTARSGRGGARCAAAAERLAEGGPDPMNRKLIRPDLSEIKEQLHTSKSFRARKPIPPEQTSAESFYYLKQMTNKTRMVIMLKDGEEIRGTIEWYDKSALKVHRTDAPNILLPKDNIKYMYKENEDKGADED
jgi:small nuclear ribonucleoprotein (snRNP)-like protein